MVLVPQSRRKSSETSFIIVDWNDFWVGKGSRDNKIREVGFTYSVLSVCTGKKNDTNLTVCHLLELRPLGFSAARAVKGTVHPILGHCPHHDG